MTTVNQIFKQQIFEGQNGGTLSFRGEGQEPFQLTDEPQFTDYLRSGWEIALVAAIDFTSSNGDQREPDSLHYLGAEQNCYEKAILDVGSVVETYDHEQQIQAFGFGGIPRHLGLDTVNHCFALNGNPSEPEINGTKGVRETYKRNLQYIEFGGPTLFAPLLTAFLDHVSHQEDENKYHILMILTDGTIHDMAMTRSLIVQLSVYPVSIIIIGVGDANFDAMVELDSDDGILRDDFGNASLRDIVQFVEYNKAIQSGNFAEQVLEEVPDQFLSHMDRIGFHPDPIEHDFSAYDGQSSSTFQLATAAHSGIVSPNCD